MKSKLTILILFYFINYITTFPSEEIWNKVKDYIKDGKMLIQNKTYFIYDENNYTKLELNDTKMQNLYKRQEKLFKKNGIANYIFVVDFLDEKEELIEKAADNLYNYISNYFNVNMSNSVIALFSMKSRRIRIKLGILTQKNISDSNAKSIIKDLGSYLRNEDYYNAWIKLIDDIDRYFNEEISFFWIIIFFIFVVVIIIIQINDCINGKIDCINLFLGESGYSSGKGGDSGGKGGATGGW